MFGFERKIRIRFGDIRYATLVRTTSIMLRSQCSSEEESGTGEALEEHTFRSFHDRQRILSVILDAYKNIVGREFSNENCPPDALILNKEEKNIFNTPLKKIIQRRGLEKGLNDDQSQIELPPFDPRLNESTSNEDDNIDAGSNNNHPVTPVPRRRAHTFESFSSYSIGRPRNRGTVESISSYSIGEENFIKTKDDIEREWNDTKEMFEESYSEIAVTSETIPMTLSEFQKRFIDDESPNSMPMFHETVLKDENVQCSRWNPNISNTKKHEYVECNRTMTYLHKRTARIGPSSLFLECKQIYRRYADLGLILNSVRKAEGMPYNFELQEQWIIESRGDQVAINVRFRIHFNEKPPMGMIKKTIMSQTKKEVSKWFKMYFDMVNSTMGRRNDLSRNVSGVTTDSYLKLGCRWLNGINICILLISCVLLHSLRLQYRVHILEDEVKSLEWKNRKILSLLDQIFLEDSCEEKAQFLK
jgi:hypothetical protein